MKKILCLLAVLALYAAVEARSQEIARLAGVIKPQVRPNVVVFSPDGTLLASAVDDNATVSLWDTQTGALKLRFMGEKDQLWVRGVTVDRSDIVWPSRLTFSPDSRTLVVLDYAANEIRLWSVATGRVDTTIKGLFDRCQPVFSPDGRLLAFASGAQGLKVWDVAARQLRKWNPANIRGVISLAFEPDGQACWVSILSNSKSECSLERVDLQTGRVVSQIVPEGGKPFSFGLSPDGQTLATAGVSADIKLWKAETGQMITRVGAREKPLSFLVFSPDGQALATWNEEGDIKVWRKQTVELIVSFKGQPGEVPRFSPNGELLVTTSAQGLSLRDARTGELEQLLSGAGAPFAFSRDGGMLATTGKGGTVSLWHVSKK